MNKVSVDERALPVTVHSRPATPPERLRLPERLLSVGGGGGGGVSSSSSPASNGLLFPCVAPAQKPLAALRHPSAAQTFDLSSPELSEGSLVDHVQNEIGAAALVTATRACDVNLPKDCCVRYMVCGTCSLNRCTRTHNHVLPEKQRHRVLLKARGLILAGKAIRGADDMPSSAVFVKNLQVRLSSSLASYIRTLGAWVPTLYSVRPSQHMAPKFTREFD